MSLPVLSQINLNTLGCKKAPNKDIKDHNPQSTLFLQENVKISQSQHESDDVTLLEYDTDFNVQLDDEQDSRPSSTGSNFDVSLSSDYTHITESVSSVVEKSDLTDLVRRELFFYTQTGLLSYENFDQLYSTVNSKSGLNHIEVRAICATVQKNWNQDHTSFSKFAICPKRCVAFTKEHLYLTKCPDCGTPRDLHCYLTYNSIRPLIGSIMANPYSRAQIELSNMHKPNRYHLDLSIMVEQNFTINQINFDVVSVAINNFSRDLRAQEQSVHVCIAYPAAASKNKLQYFLAPLIEDLTDLHDNGIAVKVSESRTEICKCTVQSVIGGDFATTASMISALKGPDTSKWDIHNGVTAFAELANVEVPRSFPADLTALLFETVFAKGIHQTFFAKDKSELAEQLTFFKKAIVAHLPSVLPLTAQSLLKKSNPAQVKASNWRIGHKLFFGIFFCTYLRTGKKGADFEVAKLLVELNGYCELFSAEDLSVERLDQMKWFIQQFLERMKTLSSKLPELKKMNSVPCHMLLSACDMMKCGYDIADTHCFAKDLALPWIRNYKAKTTNSVGTRLTMKSVHDCLWFKEYEYDCDSETKWKAPAKWKCNRKLAGHQILQKRIQKRIMAVRALRETFRSSFKDNILSLDDLHIVNYTIAVIRGVEFKVNGTSCYAKIKNRYQHGSAVYVRCLEFIEVELSQFPSKFAIVEHMEASVTKHRLPIPGTGNELVIGRTYTKTGAERVDVVEVNKYTWESVSIIPLDPTTSFVYDTQLCYSDIITDGFPA
ncbi:hypothetical protein OGAPHI_004989 [Ogataea philodendri]|uniref:Uncharacterized protein n=1 Tax=Ogataea philodendri TaxID=1378263 RepID=A0A9P8T281_9ASCO|nr:uncharacterized protein OGAPHI_004989 [Ogataea philodendri]KAH3663588.1 hypothetical protein OGAPHI_004989 [Ogataea philodendri]